MLTEKEAYSLIKEAHEDLVEIIDLLNESVPHLIGIEKINELDTLLFLTFSHIRANLDGMEMALKYIKPSSVQKLT